MANEDLAYCRWLRKQPCGACLRESNLTITVHHHTKRRSFGRRAHDREAMPLCARCHDDFHSGRGVFLKWTREMRTLWQDAQVARLRAVYEQVRELKPDGAPDDSEDIF